MIFFAQSGPTGSHSTCKPFLTARLRAVSIQPPTSRTEFARLPQQATPLRRPTPDNTAGLLEQIKELSRQVASLWASQTHSCPHSRVRHHSHSRDHRSSTPDKSLQPHDIRWYHWQFGDEAQKCSPPCPHQQRDFRQQRDFCQQRDSHQQENSTGGR